MPKTVLIVDDDPDMLDLLRLALNEAGYATRTANTGTEALSTAQRSPPDLVLLDVVLPDVNGFTVCENLRHHPATASVPVILLTVVTGEFPRLVGTESGADDYLHKPFQVPDLISRVAGVLRRTSGSPIGRHRHQEIAVRRELAYCPRLSGSPV
jgi:DNA-binding response OmpR family regulator